MKCLKCESNQQIIDIDINQIAEIITKIAVHVFVWQQHPKQKIVQTVYI